MASFTLHRIVRATPTEEHTLARRLSLPGGEPVDVPADQDEHVDDLIAVVKATCELLGEDANAMTVRVETDWGDCEQCGGYENVTWTVVRNGAPLITFRHNGHFGGGDDLQDVDGLAIRTLAKLGHSVTTTVSGSFVLNTLFGTLLDAHLAESMGDLDDTLARTLPFELCLDRVTVISGAFLDALLHRLPPPVKVTVPSDLLPGFRSALDWVEKHGTYSRGHAAAFRTRIEVDGALDQARRIPLPLLTAYIAGDEAAHEAICRDYPLLTWAAVVKIAPERGIPVPA